MSSLNPRQKRNLRDILVSLVLFFGLIAIEKLVPQVGNNRLYMFLLFLVPYFIVGHNVVRKALLAIKNFQGFDESFLMTLATVGAFATGENAEAVAVMLFYQVGEWFQDYAVDKSRRSITALMDIMPDEAHVEVNGEIETMDPDDVEVGSIVVVKAGEKIPLDGKVVEGHSMVNTAAITGESVPRSVTLGDEIYSGSINGEGLLKIQTTKAYEDSTVSKILEMVENAAEKKSKTENFITKFARIYTPAVVIGAIVLAIVPSLITGEWLKWLYRACTFLVISCPCAYPCQGLKLSRSY
ncbi:HAD-IC family P-type ATPase [Sharpea azabuensis]|uniref:HAD-IC family P-type ATPase n=1 Tax=Sharpea azabuensis TaxID=322505 RepID=UPI00156811A1|nr:HAD-IC family P-type ATPase [Sharpea azabuensis]